MLNIKSLHGWDLSPGAAIALQQTLRDQITLIDRTPDFPTAIQTVAGVDVGFEAAGSITRAAVAVLSFPALQVVDRAIARRPTTFPYIPGLLSFREIPAVLEALVQLTILPDILLCDGQGTAHPRRFGIACHLGLLTDLPAIGVGKSRLVGRHAEVGHQRGDWQLLIHQQETIGAVLRTRPGTKPLFISPGHNVSLTTAIAIVLQCSPKYRLPETTRQAHKLASGPAIDPPPTQISLFD